MSEGHNSICFTCITWSRCLFPVSHFGIQPLNLHRLPPVSFENVHLCDGSPSFYKHPGLSLRLICMEAILRTCFSSPLLFFSSLLSLIFLSGSLVRLHRVLKSLVHLVTSSNCSSLQCPPTIPFHISEFGFFSPEYSFSFCVCGVHLFFPKNWDLNFISFF